MPSKIFISWGGDLSRKIAEELCDWIPSVLQFVKPYFSPEDIEKGARWESNIAEQLSECNVGLICLTSDNLQRPWILFEAGALSKNLEHSRVCPILFNVEPTEVSGPLASFQSTKFIKDDFRKLLMVINETGDEYRLDDAVFNRVFDKWWPDFEMKISEILNSREPVRKAKQVTGDEMLKEILALTRMNTRRNSNDMDYACAALERLLTSIDDAMMDHIQFDMIPIKDLDPSIQMLCDALGCRDWFNKHMVRRRELINKSLK